MTLFPTSFEVPENLQRPAPGLIGWVRGVSAFRQVFARGVSGPPPGWSYSATGAASASGSHAKRLAVRVGFDRGRIMELAAEAGSAGDGDAADALTCAFGGLR